MNQDSVVSPAPSHRYMRSVSESDGVGMCTVLPAHNPADCITCVRVREQPQQSRLETADSGIFGLLCVLNAFSNSYVFLLDFIHRK